MKNPSHTLTLDEIAHTMSSEGMKGIVTDLRILTVKPDPVLLETARIAHLEPEPDDPDAFRMTISGPDLDRKALVAICDSVFDRFADGVEMTLGSGLHTIAIFSARLAPGRDDAIELVFDIDPFED